MAHEGNYFITSSNFKKIVRASNIEVKERIVDVYRSIYDANDLSKILNHNEALSIRKFELFLQESDARLMELERLNKFKDQVKKLSPSKSKFIFESGAPKYHTSSSCETLSRDFDNFEIPKEIISRGADQIIAFRNFAQQNKKLIGDGREDVFLKRLQEQFNLKSRIDKVSFPNSGKTDVPTQSDIVTVEEIANEIESKIKKIHGLSSTEEGLNAVKKLMYAPQRLLYDPEIRLNHSERILLETKRDLMNLVVQYHTYKRRDGTTTFSESLLKFYGFKPCGICCKENIDLGF